MSQQYVQITKREFDDFINSLTYKFKRVYFDYIQEYVYDLTLKRDGHTYVLRLWSSVDKRDNLSRSCGDDAIRLSMLYKSSDKKLINYKPVLSTKSTYRTGGWKKRLKRKINEMESRLGEVKKCQSCGKVMVIRNENKTGDEFWGCTGFSDDGCRYTENKT